jgi:hypothetical protein
VTLPQIQIARGHWVLGALFLAIILEEYLPRRGRDGRSVRSRSLLVPWALMLGGAGVWATVVFADVVHDMLIHFLWADILFAAGALELARRRGVYERPWLDGVLPFAFVGCGALFIVHEQIHSTGPSVPWHLAMGGLLMTGGLLEFVRLWRRRSPQLQAAVFPLSAFALLVIAIPVAAAS